MLWRLGAVELSRAAWKSKFENNLALGERLKRFEIFLRETL